MKTVLVAGGTGGHLIPALALAEALKGLGPCLLVSTSRPVDHLLASTVMTGPVISFRWITVDLKRFTPLWRWLSPWYTWDQLRAVRKVWSILRQDRPDIVVGFGGYLSAVGVMAGRLLGLPTVLHEQNFLPGRANRILARLVRCVAVSFPQTKGHLSPRARVEVTGNPLRPLLREVSIPKAREHFGLDLDRPVLLIMGGSQGSQSINQLSIAMWEALPLQDRKAVQVIHLTGRSQAGLVEQAYHRLGVTSRVYPFLHEIPLAYAAANLGVARAGATTIAEMVELQLPAILIPYPHAGGHQQANAHWMESIGGAVVLLEGKITPQLLSDQIFALLRAPDRLTRMQAALLSQGNGSAADRLGSLVRTIAGGAG